MDDMSKAAFTIAYDGDALRDHSMDVRDLAPALLGVGKLFEAANAALNGEEAQTKIHVKALNAGSFEITFQVLQSIPSHILSILTGNFVTAAANLGGLIGLGATGIASLIFIIKKFKGKDPDNIIPLDENTVRLQFGDEIIDVPLNVLKLMRDLGVRESLQKIVEEPLKREGISTFEVRSEGNIVLSVDKEDSVYFRKPREPDETITDEHRKTAFSISALAFKGENKWKLYDGQSSINAKIADDDFLKKVDSDEISFSKGDILICDVHITQKRTDKGLKTEYVVEKVIEHQKSPRQISMDFPE